MAAGPMVTIEVLFFAAARERMGQASKMIPLPEGASVGALFDALVTDCPELAPLKPYLRFAVNEEFVSEQYLLRPEDVVALIPPVSGGSPNIIITEAAIDSAAIEALVAHDTCGALLSFQGTVRSNTGEHGVLRLEYEAYKPMALKKFGAMVAEVTAQHPGVRVAICHRVGTLQVGDVAVVIAVASPHRAPAFDACRWLIEQMKADVPIFKREVREGGTVWVGMGS